MVDCPIARRLLLSRAGAGLAVMGTFLLPPEFAAAAQATRSRRHPSHGARPPLPMVMLDPGHGGKDPGAIGVSGTYEKHIALATALELRHLLERSGRYRVAMTRAKDHFIPLEDRVSIAQEHGAALFVSMHADSLRDHSVRGASVYTLSNKASDAQTAELAASENSADRFAPPGQRVSPEVARILASLVRRETRIDSARLARKVVGSLDDAVPMLDNPDRHAGFVVLKSADIPSILVEMGFMSNPRDEAQLRRPHHRLVVAQAMRHAVDAYFTASHHTAVPLGAQMPA